MCEFSLQLNLLTELIQENQPQEPAPEVLAEDDDDVPPSLEAILDDEQATATSTSAATTVTLLCTWISASYSTRMASPFSRAQLAMEMTNPINELATGNLNEEVRADVDWQAMFQSCDACAPEAETDWESDWESSDVDELVGFFGLHVSESCLVTTRKCTLWPHTRTYVDFQVICPDANEGDLYLCKALPDKDWITAEGVIEVTFTNSRWAHIDNDTEHRTELKSS